MMIGLRHIYPANGDLNVQLNWWFWFLDQNGFHGIATIRQHTGADVTPIWYYVLFLFTKSGLYARLTPVYCIRSLAIVGTIVAVVCTYFIVKTLIKRPGSWQPLIFAAIVPFLPAFFMDLLKTNIPDSIYLSLDLVALLAMLKKRPGLAWLAVGVAISFKAMAIYFVPFLLFVWLKRLKSGTIWDRLAPLFVIPGFLVTCIPAYLAGMSLYDATIGVLVSRSGAMNYEWWGIWQILFSGAPPWMPGTPTADQASGLMLYGAATAALAFLVLFVMLFNVKDRQTQFQAAWDLLVAAPIICYLFMPAQHEIYWALASVIALFVYAMRRSRASLAVLLVLSFSMLEMYLGGRVMPAVVFDYIVLAVAGYLCWRIFRATELYSNWRKSPLPELDL